MNIKYVIFITVLFLCLTNQLSAQNRGGQNPVGVVEGKIIDQQTSEPVEYANVLILKTSDSSMVSGTISDSRGRYTISEIPNGKYIMQIRFIGYENYYSEPFQITPSIVNLRMPDVLIKPNMAVLQGVSVTAEKPLITSNLDKRVVNVDRSLSLSGGTAADVMQNVPGVTVSEEGNISIRGGENITLLIDGKPASQSGISSSDILNQLPASSISSIEVVTNPSVRYDPEGTSGIVNIVLVKKSLQGFNGQLSATYGFTDRYNGSLNLNYRHSKFNFFSSIDFRDFTMNRYSEDIRRSFSNNDTATLIQIGDNKNFRKFNNISAGVDYNIDARNSITLSSNYRMMNFGSTGTTDYTNYDKNMGFVNSFSRFSENDRSINSLQISASYKHVFERKGHEFTSDIIYNNNQVTAYSFNDQSGLKFADTVFNNLSRQKSDQNNHANMILFQSNYTHPFLNGSRIEAGYKVSFRKLDSKQLYYSYNFSDELWYGMPARDNRYLSDEYIYAGYALYSNSFKKLKYQAGLRYEYAYLKYETMQSDKPTDVAFPDLFPSVHFAYDLGNKQEMSLSYSKRVMRPGPWFLNPYIDYSDSLNLRSGNPDLKPELTNSYELGYQKILNKGSFSATAFFRNTTNGINNIQTMDTNGIFMTRPENLGKVASGGLELMFGYSFAKWLKVNTSVSSFQFWSGAIPEYEIKEINMFSWNARINVALAYNQRGSFQITSNYGSPTVRGQREMKSDFATDVSWQHDVWKDKLTLTARVSDVFDTRKHESVITGSNYIQESMRKRDSRIFFVGFQLKLNNFKRHKPTQDIMEDGGGGGDMD